MTTEHKKYLKKLKIDYLVTKSLQIGILIAFFGFWELAVKLGIIDPFFFSSPSLIVKTISDLISSGDFFNHVAVTLLETIIGFLLSTVVGTLIAIILWSSRMTRKVSEPYLIVANALPKIALGPILIIWLGTGQTAIIAMALLICVVITIMTMLAGFLSVDQEKIRLLEAMGAKRIQILWKLILPANIPTLVSVMKINVGLSWVGTIMGEYLVSRAGLGYLIVYGSQIFNLDLVMAATFTLSVLACLMYGCVALIEKWLKK